MPRFAAAFLQQPYFPNDHAAVDRFTHVVDRQQCDLGGGQGFHFDAGLTVGFDRRLTTNPIVLGFRLQFNVDMGNRQRMAQWNQVGGFFAGHDACDTGDSEYIPLLVAALKDHRKGLRLHADTPFGDGPAPALGFVADIDHVRFPGAIEMTERVGHDGDCNENFHCIIG